jgi:hypothetical protein
MNDRKELVRRIRNLDWPRYLMTVQCAGWTLIFLWVLYVAVNITDSCGLDTDWAEPIFGHHFLKLEAFNAEIDYLLEAAGQGKR